MNIKLKICGLMIGVWGSIIMECLLQDSNLKQHPSWGWKGGEKGGKNWRKKAGGGGKWIRKAEKSMKNERIREWGRFIRNIFLQNISL